MYTNTDVGGITDKNDVKKSLFDPVEIKGISLKSAKAFLSGRLARGFRSISKCFSLMSSRTYGLAFLSFGVLTLFLHLAEYYFMSDPSVEVSTLVIGAVFTVISLFFLPSDKPISDALQSVKLLDFIVFDFFSVNRKRSSDNNVKISAVFGIVPGFLLAILGFFVPTEYAVLLILVTFFIVVSMVSAEFPYIVSLVLFPYLSLLMYSEYILVFLVCTTIISFARKVFVGKRIYSFEIYDFLFLFLILSIFVLSIVAGDHSTESTLLTMVFLAGYFPTSNIMVNRRLLDCVAGAISASSIPVAIYSVVYFVVSLFSENPVGRVEFFTSPEILGAYLAVVAVFSAYLAKNRSRRIKKAYYLFVFIIALAALITNAPFAFLIMLLPVFASIAVIHSKRMPIFFVLLISALPVVLFFLSDSLLEALSNVFKISPDLIQQKIATETVFDIFTENPLLLVSGDSSIASADLGINAYLTVICRFGCISMAAILFTLILRTLHFGMFRKYFHDSTVNFYAEISLIASVCILTLGSFVNIFSDIVMVYFLAVVFAVGSAALRTSQKEKADMRSYYRELGRSDLAAIDIALRK